ncbi:putative eka-like protein [Erysiphe necator]|uniref:Putative eka-like protein n=1 Tax=Uncinula necator TaxID=52586 RepID=A0A0B1P2G9_UNCNE|nr:putative eka-like protein [Erysiphe necator]
MPAKVPNTTCFLPILNTKKETSIRRKLEKKTNRTIDFLCALRLTMSVPRSITMLEGQVEVTKSMLADEIERVSTMRPAFVKPYGASNPDAPHRTWMAFFSEIPRIGFRVFDESGVTRNFKKKQQIEFCKRCNGHHNIRICLRAPSCGNYGSTIHSQDMLELSAEQTDEVNETPDSYQTPEANAEDSKIAPFTTSTGVEMA